MPGPVTPEPSSDHRKIRGRPVFCAGDLQPRLLQPRLAMNAPGSPPHAATSTAEPSARAPAGIPIHGGEGSPRAYARAAGLGYLLIIVTGIYAEFFVRSSLIVPGDAAATASNIAAAEAFFRTALASEFVMLLADVGVALALYVVFRGVSRSLALLAAFFRLAHAAVVGANLLNTYIPLLLLGGAGGLAAFGADQRSALALMFLEAHGYGYAIGLVFFGAYCFVLGYLVLRSGYVPRVLGVLLMVAAAGYLVDSFGRTLLVDYAAYESIFALLVFAPAFIAELSFALWLVVKGVDVRNDAIAGGAR
jgi:hypothetical protein